MHRFSRTVLGYHGCLKTFAGSILNGDTAISDWRESSNGWDWLGRGIYFWEHAPERAGRWAVEYAKERGGEPAIIGAVIDLGRCFDLTDVRFAGQLGSTYALLKDAMDRQGIPMPKNSGGLDRKNRQLDCLVINSCLDQAPEIQTVRSPFSEGGEAYPDAQIMRETHIQVAVRDRACILGVFRPTLTT